MEVSGYHHNVAGDFLSSAARDLRGGRRARPRFRGLKSPGVVP